MAVELVVVLVAVVVVVTVMVMNRRSSAAVTSALAAAEASRPRSFTETEMLALCQQAFQFGSAAGEAHSKNPSGFEWAFTEDGVRLVTVEPLSRNREFVETRHWVFGEAQSVLVSEYARKSQRGNATPRADEPPDWAA